MTRAIALVLTSRTPAERVELWRRFSPGMQRTIDKWRSVGTPYLLLVQLAHGFPVMYLPRDLVELRAAVEAAGQQLMRCQARCAWLVPPSDVDARAVVRSVQLVGLLERLPGVGGVQ